MVAASPDYLKAGRSRRMEEHEAKASNIKETALKTQLFAGVEGVCGGANRGGC
jgi:hypothetical protein